MIDGITFKNTDSATPGVDLNTVVNGAGISLKSFETEVDTRNTERAREMQHGLHPSNMLYGKRIFRLEGDIMDTTPALYWTRRRDLLREFTLDAITLNASKYVGRLTLTLPGFASPLYADCVLESYPEIPIGLAGATISPWMVALKAPDPALYETAFSQYNLVPNAGATNITGLSGNAPIFPIINITGPFNTGAQIYIDAGWVLTLDFSASAGQSVSIDPKNKVVSHSGGTLVYDDLTWSGGGFAGFGWNMLALDPRDGAHTMRWTATGTTGASNLNVIIRNGYYI